MSARKRSQLITSEERAPASKQLFRPFIAVSPAPALLVLLLFTRLRRRMAVTSHPSTSATYVVGSSQGTATDLSHAAIGGLRTRPNSRYFHADDGRVLIPRGCNVSGLNKLPTSPDGRTHLSEGFYDTEHVSFVGRPFPLDEA